MKRQPATATLSLLNEQATCSEARVEVAKAEADIAADRDKLNRLMGLCGRDTSWTVADQLPEIPGNEISTSRLESLALNQRSDLTSLATALQSTRTYRYIGVLEVGPDLEKDTDIIKLKGSKFNLSLPAFNRGQGKTNRFFPAHQSGHQLFQRPSTHKQIPCSIPFKL